MSSNHSDWVPWLPSLPNRKCYNGGPIARQPVFSSGLTGRLPVLAFLDLMEAGSHQPLFGRFNGMERRWRVIHKAYKIMSGFDRGLHLQGRGAVSTSYVERKGMLWLEGRNTMNFIIESPQSHRASVGIRPIDVYRAMILYPGVSPYFLELVIQRALPYTC